MQTRNPRREKSNPARRKASKVNAPETPATSDITGSDGAVQSAGLRLQVDVQFADDAGDLTYIDLSGTGVTLESFMVGCAQATVYSLQQQLMLSPAIAASTDPCTAATADAVALLHSAQALLADKNPHAVTIRLVSSSEMADLNKGFRGKTGPTNVLSFAALDQHDDDLPELAQQLATDKSGEFLADLGSAEDSWLVPLGDIAICADVVRLEAHSQQKTAIAHLAHMVVHGMLHLIGYDHENELEAGIMESAEIMILGQLGFDNPYAIVESPGW